VWQARDPEGTLQVPTHAELAWQLNTTRESVTRVMQKLLSDGVVVRESERWLIVQAEVLRDLARGRRE
jgi:DNA-binding GntR family transcriptional regulator